MTAGGIDGLPALLRSADQSPAQIIEMKARLLLVEAEALGVHLYISPENGPGPLAKGNHVPRIEVWMRKAKS